MARRRPFAGAETTIQNTEPTLSALAFSSSGVVNSDVLTCSVTVNDPDETNVAREHYRILRGSTFDRCDCANPEDEVTCSVSVTDDNGVSNE